MTDLIPVLIKGFFVGILILFIQNMIKRYKRKEKK